MDIEEYLTVREAVINLSSRVVRLEAEVRELKEGLREHTHLVSTTDIWDET